MSSQTMNLPINIPWKLIAASPDMLDTKFCNEQFPFAWRSSLAISAYEPKQEELPEELGGNLVTYLKVTCSITGYQPTGEETDAIYNSFADQPTEDQRQALDRILGEYFACYGALLNIAVFPKPEYEHWIEEFEKIEFARDIQKITQLPNPHDIRGVVFKAFDQPANRTVDVYPLGGDGMVELDLFKQMDVAIPLSFEVRASLVHYGSEPVTMTAFRGNQGVGKCSTGGQQRQVQELRISIEGGIDRIIFDSPGDKACLLSLSLCERLARPIDAPIEKLPRIVDFEPKTRDLYQAATEAGEILTASVSGIKTDKSFTHTESTETGLSLSAAGGYSPGQAGGFGASMEGGLTHKWGETDQDSRTIQTDASRERRESQSTTTNISQLYNLLTGYHAGTNRAVFLMLARPHMLQPTEFRTFVSGLRAIEGMQELFLIVNRRKDVEQLCVEVMLETGNYPESTEIIPPPTYYDEKIIQFEINRLAIPGKLGERDKNTIDFKRGGFEVDGWEFDFGKGDSGHPALHEQPHGDDNADPDNETSPGWGWDSHKRLEKHEYQVVVPGEVTVQATIWSEAWMSPMVSPDKLKVRFHRTYTVFLRRPKQSAEQPRADAEKLLITSRSLCACLEATREHGVVRCIDKPPSDAALRATGIVDEVPMRVAPSLTSEAVLGKSRLPLSREIMRQIRSALASSWRRPSRRPSGVSGFLDSDYFKDRIKAILPKATLGRAIKSVENLPPSVVARLGEECTIDEALKFDLQTLMTKTGLSARAAADARRIMLGLKPEPIEPRRRPPRDSVVAKREDPGAAEE